MTEFCEGIYLETKHSQVGTGHTSSNTVFRNFYAVRPAGRALEAHLLDNQLVPVGICENMTPEELAKSGWQYIAQLQARYEGLKGKLASPPPPAAPPQPVSPAKPTAAPAMAKPAPAAKHPDKPKEMPWWELTQKGAGSLIKKD